MGALMELRVAVVGAAGSVGPSTDGGSAPTVTSAPRRPPRRTGGNGRAYRRCPWRRMRPGVSPPAPPAADTPRLPLTSRKIFAACVLYVFVMLLWGCGRWPSGCLACAGVHRPLSSGRSLWVGIGRREHPRISSTPRHVSSSREHQGCPREGNRRRPAIGPCSCSCTFCSCPHQPKIGTQPEDGRREEAVAPASSHQGQRLLPPSPVPASP